MGYSWDMNIFFGMHVPLVEYESDMNGIFMGENGALVG